MPALTLRNATPADAPRCYEIEISAYEGDEAATLEKIATRIALYPARLPDSGSGRSGSGLHQRRLRP